MPHSSEEYASKSDFERLSILVKELAEKIGTDDAAANSAMESGDEFHPDKLVEQVTQQVTAYVHAHPVRAAVMAFILGLLIAGRRRR